MVPYTDFTVLVGAEDGEGDGFEGVEVLTGVAVMRESGGVDIFRISELSKGIFDISQEK